MPSSLLVPMGALVTSSRLTNSGTPGNGPQAPLVCISSDREAFDVRVYHAELRPKPALKA